MNLWPSPLSEGAPGKRPILVVLHQATSTPGRVGIMLRELGLPLDIRRPALGDRLPETLEAHSGAVVFGGPMSAYDDEDYIRQETDWLAIPLKEERPFLGICLGAQLLAQHLGGRVASHPKEHGEYGWYDLAPTEAGEAYIAGWPRKVLQFHKDGMTLPEGASLLARGGDEFPNQAFMHDERTIGIQFHPELTGVMLHRWCTKAKQRFEMPGTSNARETLEGRFRYDPPLADWARRLLARLFEKG